MTLHRQSMISPERPQRDAQRGTETTEGVEDSKGDREKAPREIEGKTPSVLGIHTAFFSFCKLQFTGFAGLFSFAHAGLR